MLLDRNANNTRGVSTVGRGLFVLTATAALFACPALGLAQTAFSYQGQLKDAGLPLNGTVDIDASLWDAVELGNQVGATVNLVGVTVANGLFTAQLDFGLASYDGSARWLELVVNGVTLAPRQELTPTPHAIFAAKPWVTTGPDVSYTVGKVGIGTAEPMALLHVGGAAGVDGIMFPDGTLQTTAAIGTPGGSIWSLNGSNAYYNAGNVGVGTAAPDAKLQVVGGPLWTSNSWGKSFHIGNGQALELGGNGTNFGIGNSFNSLYLFRTTTEAVNAPANYFMSVDSAGRIAMGDITGAVTAKVTVFGTGDGAQLLRLNTERPWSFRQKYSGSGSALQLIPDTGLKNFEISATGGTGVAIFVGDDAFPRMGVGTLAPICRLHVLANTSGASAIYGQSTAGTSVSGVYGGSDASNGNGVIGDAPTGTSAYGVWGRASQGIGGVFTGGTLALWAQGRARVNVLEITGGSDFSENFDVVNAQNGADDEAKPGMIVCIDAKTPGKLMLSHRSYDPTVAGIISGAGGVEVGMTMGQAGTLADGKHPVALTGRVYAHCDASTAAIQPGDLLTTSDTPGHAMKSSDRERSHGTVIGKAMTGLAKGERGLVLVLVNLQ